MNFQEQDYKPLIHLISLDPKLKSFTPTASSSTTKEFNSFTPTPPPTIIEVDSFKDLQKQEQEQYPILDNNKDEEELKPVTVKSSRTPKKETFSATKKTDLSLSYLQDNRSKTPKTMSNNSNIEVRKNTTQILRENKTNKTIDYSINKTPEQSVDYKTKIKASDYSSNKIPEQIIENKGKIKTIDYSSTKSEQSIEIRPKNKTIDYTPPKTPEQLFDNRTKNKTVYYSSNKTPDHKNNNNNNNSNNDRAKSPFQMSKTLSQSLRTLTPPGDHQMNYTNKLFYSDMKTGLDVITELPSRTPSKTYFDTGRISTEGKLTNKFKQSPISSSSSTSTFKEVKSSTPNKLSKPDQGFSSTKQNTPSTSTSTTTTTITSITANNITPTTTITATINNNISTNNTTSTIDTRKSLPQNFSMKNNSCATLFNKPLPEESFTSYNLNNYSNFTPDISQNLRHSDSNLSFSSKLSTSEVLLNKGFLREINGKYQILDSQLDTLLEKNQAKMYKEQSRYIPSGNNPENSFEQPRDKFSIPMLKLDRSTYDSFITEDEPLSFKNTNYFPKTNNSMISISVTSRYQTNDIPENPSEIVLTDTTDDFKKDKKSPMNSMIKINPKETEKSNDPLNKSVSQRAEEWLKEKQRKIEMQKKIEESKELFECSFKPMLISKPYKTVSKSKTPTRLPERNITPNSKSNRESIDGNYLRNSKHTPKNSIGNPASLLASDEN